MTIFQKSVIKRHLDNLDKEQVEKAYQKFRENYSPDKIEEIKKLKEEEYQDGFLRDLFVNVFGYILKPDSNYNLAREFKNQGDGKKADGAILKNEKAVAVIELKSTKTKDLKSITEQAFNYKNNQPECKYVITSNFQKPFRCNRKLSTYRGKLFYRLMQQAIDTPPQPFNKIVKST